MSSDSSLSRAVDQSLRELYGEAARTPDPTLCCVEGGAFQLPDLAVPQAMWEMNYGCGSTVHPGDLTGTAPILYIGVGGGLEALQFAYFRRRAGGVIAVDPVPDMRAAAARNLAEAARLNPWFDPSFVRIVDGAADRLPAADASVEVVAQNCLFNVFAGDDLARAVAEVARILRPGGRFSSSDPVAERPLPDALRRNPSLRARCVSGCITTDEYLERLAGAGFRRIAVRARRPYRLLLPSEFAELDEPVLLESLEVLAERGAGAAAPIEVHRGRAAIYAGRGTFTSRHGIAFAAGTPVNVSEHAAAELASRPDFVVTEATDHVRTFGCC